MLKKISIVGAGPGDPELLTVKAHRLLKQADVVLYDSLMGTEILKLIPWHAQKIHVGKTYNDNQNQEERQIRINQMMKENYLAGKKVVRLKTGDPLIFGRGVEEIRYLIENQLDYELVPGITAGIAAANHFEIPITERAKNTTLMFCTGTTAKNDMEQFQAISYMIKKGTPLILYMGLKNLPNIIEKFNEEGVSMQTPICAASKVSYSEEDWVSGTLENILQNLEEHPLATPTILLIGENLQSLRDQHEAYRHQFSEKAI
ncbi:MAG: uroporphyrinogen-III C-methyltransferase [Marinifilaceae bacterium]